MALLIGPKAPCFQDSRDVKWPAHGCVPVKQHCQQCKSTLGGLSEWLKLRSITHNIPDNICCHTVKERRLIRGGEV